MGLVGSLATAIVFWFASDGYDDLEVELPFWFIVGSFTLVFVVPWTLGLFSGFVIRPNW